MSIDVLIADQDVELARLYCRFLSEKGLSAEIAETGLECLKRVHWKKPDVLVLDHDLAWGDAEGVLACLREDRFPLPVILTSWNIASESIPLLEPPVVQCLRKFFPLPALLDEVKRATEIFEIHAFCRNFELSRRRNSIAKTDSQIGRSKLAL